MQKHEIQSIFNLFNNKRVAIIGDVMIDSYVWGYADRISPEAPVPVISVTKRESRLGGAANVALNIKSLGATPIMIAISGNDEKGAELVKLMQTAKIGTNGIIQSQDRKTTVKHRVIASNQHILRIDEETTENLSNRDEQIFINHVLKLLVEESPDVIIFEDYDKGNITPAVISEIVKFANNHQIPTLVDPKKRNFNFYNHVTLFKPNFKEMIEGLKIEPIAMIDTHKILAAANQLRENLNTKYVMITLSEHGIFITDGKEYFSMPAQRREIADVSGAGDTVISVVTLAMSCGLKMKDMATIANIAGGLVCEKVGVVSIDKNQLLKETILYYSNN